MHIYAVDADYNYTQTSQLRCLRTLDKRYSTQTERGGKKEGETTSYEGAHAHTHRPNRTRDQLFDTLHKSKPNLVVLISSSLLSRQAAAIDRTFSKNNGKHAEHHGGGKMATQGPILIAGTSILTQDESSVKNIRLVCLRTVIYMQINNRYVDTVHLDLLLRMTRD
jgi:hypothetical protein